MDFKDTDHQNWLFCMELRKCLLCTMLITIISMGVLGSLREPNEVFYGFSCASHGILGGFRDVPGVFQGVSEDFKNVLGVFMGFHENAIVFQRRFKDFKGFSGVFPEGLWEYDFHEVTRIPEIP